MLPTAREARMKRFRRVIFWTHLIVGLSMGVVILVARNTVDRCIGKGT